LTSLPSVCRALCDGGSTHGFELARWLVTNEWARVVAHVRQLREEPNPQLALDALSRMSKPILGLLEGSRISNHHELHTEMTRFLTSLETDYPIRGMVHLLRTAHETQPREALPGLGLATVHGHSTQALTTRLGMPAREEDDWAISAPIRCRCRLCATPVGLASHPELGRCRQEACEAQGSIGGDAAFAEHGLIQAVQRDSKAAGGFA